MQRAAAWLCFGTGEESCGNVLSKATRRRFGRWGEDADAEATEKWVRYFCFLVVRHVKIYPRKVAGFSQDS